MNATQLAKKIGVLLKEQSKTLAVAESCTGGFISHLITSVPGSSAYFTGAVVSYDNSIKLRILSVKPSTLKKFGAVSAECAVEMARGVKKNLKTNCTIATTGIAGPSGAVPGKPVGTVFISCCIGSKVIVERMQFKGSRKRIIEQSAQKALQMLLSGLL